MDELLITELSSYTVNMNYKSNLHNDETSLGRRVVGNVYTSRNTAILIVSANGIAIG